MNNLLNSAELSTKKTTYLLEHRHKGGKHYVTVVQSTERSKTEIVTNEVQIHPSVLLDLMEILKEFIEEIPQRQLDDTAEITQTDRAKLKEAYLKGVAIKDLKIRFNYSEDQITKVLLSQKIAIVDQSQPKYFNTWKRNRNRGQR